MHMGKPSKSRNLTHICMIIYAVHIYATDSQFAQVNLTKNCSFMTHYGYQYIHVPLN